jgi:hypothetical protein
MDHSWKVYAPCGTNDIFDKIIRPNKVQITKEIYETKVKRWISFWPDLTIIPWGNECEGGKLHWEEVLQRFTEIDTELGG